MPVAFTPTWWRPPARWRRTTSAGAGLGQHMDISVQEVAFSRQFNRVLVWQFDRRKLPRVGGALNYGLATVRCIWRLADGWCFHTLMTGRFGAPANQALSDWMDEPGWTIRCTGSIGRPTTARRWIADSGVVGTAIEAFFATRSKAEIATEGRRRGINATVIAEPADVLADPHLAAREFWEIEPTAAHRGGAFRGASCGSNLRGRRAPGAGERPLATPGAARAHRFRARRTGPLAGVRVLDFSWALVGSITTKTLGDLGADVIKVESRTRPCLSRLDVQVSASKPGNFDDKPWFAHLNTSKRSLALDMKRPESREVLKPLIPGRTWWSRISRPAPWQSSDWTIASWPEGNPSLIMVSGSVYGQTGPLAQEWGVDGTGAALSGRTYLTGWPDRDPVIPAQCPMAMSSFPMSWPRRVGRAPAPARDAARRAHRCLHVRDLRAANARCHPAGADRRTPHRDRQSRSAHVPPGRVCGEGRGSMDCHQLPTRRRLAAAAAIRGLAGGER